MAALQAAIERHRKRVTDKEDAAAKSVASVAAAAAARAAAAKAAPKANAKEVSVQGVPEIFKLPNVAPMSKFAVAGGAASLQEALLAQRVLAISEPSIISYPELVQKIVADPDGNKNIGTFCADFSMSAEYRSKHGRGQKPFDDMATATELFRGARLPSELQFTAQEIEFLGLTGKPAEMLKAWLASSSCMLWGMAPGKHYIGPEQQFLGTVRLQVQGFRQCIFMPFAAAKDAWQVGADDEAFFDFIEKASAEKHAALHSTLGQCMRGGTVGPNDLLVIPAGTLCVERTLSATTCGLKRTVVCEGDCDILQATAASRSKQSKTAKLLVDSVNKILAARAPSQAS